MFSTTTKKTTTTTSSTTSSIRAAPSSPAAAATTTAWWEQRHEQPSTVSTVRLRSSRRGRIGGEEQEEDEGRRDIHEAEATLFLEAAETTTAARADEKERQRTWTWLWVTCGIIFASYWMTLSKGIAGGDSGELVAEACHLGTVHPPGYPLLTLLLHLMIHYLPLRESPAWKANLFSAGCTTVAAGCIFSCVVLFGRARHRCYHPTTQLLAAQTRGKATRTTTNQATTSTSTSTTTTTTTFFAASSAAGLFAWSPLTWQYAVTAEVFALNNALCALLLYTTLRFACSWTSRERRLWACIGAFLCGLALTNQHTAILFEVPLILYVAWCLRRDIYSQPRAIIFELGGWFVIGLLPYVYLPFAAHLRLQPGSWGEVRTLRGLFHHVIRADYGTFKLYSGDAGGHGSLTQKLWIYLKDLSLRQGLWGLVPALASVGFLSSAALSGPWLLPPLYQGLRAKVTQATDRYVETILADIPGGGGDITITATGPYKTAERRARRENRLVVWAFVAALACYLGVFHALSNLPLSGLFYGVVARFWLQPNILIFLFAGVGLDWVVFVATWQFDGYLRGRAERRREQQEQREEQEGGGGGLWASQHERQAKQRRVRTVSLFRFLAHVLCLGLAWLQFHRNFAISDQHRATFFNQYAKSLLAPLPPQSILLVSYDMQWTSLRYMQVCEHYRTDVTILNQSLLTFKWWESKRGLYEGKVVFPGARYVSENQAAGGTNGGFSLFDFLQSNMDRTPGGIFMTGKLLHGHERQLDATYATVPVGLASQFVHLSAPWTLKKWSTRNQDAWKMMQHRGKDLLPILELPVRSKYPAETWESTIVRDYFDHLAESGAYLLEEAVKLQQEYKKTKKEGGGGGADDGGDGLQKRVTTKMSALLVLTHLLDALWWLEIVLAFDKDYAPHVLKNLGVGYEALLRMAGPEADVYMRTLLERTPNRSIFVEKMWKKVLQRGRWWRRGDREKEGVLTTTRREREEADAWTKWAFRRLDETWSAFLKREDAKQDPAYNGVKQNHEAVVGLLGAYLGGKTKNNK